MSQKFLENLSQYLLIACHTAGAVGFIFLGAWFWNLTWFNLLLCTCIVLLFSKQSIEKILLPFFLAAIIGFTIEIIGVHTGFPFGRYQYGSAFGFKIGAVPIMIGINWALDFLIEQICMHYNFWHFYNGKAGIANYVAWFFTAGLISFFTLKNFSNHTNTMAIKLFFYQILFFISLNLYQFIK
jgi:bisanhydrobacterioruberin hydratase